MNYKVIKRRVSGCKTAKKVSRVCDLVMLSCLLLMISTVNQGESLLASQVDGLVAIYNYTFEADFISTLISLAGTIFLLIEYIVICYDDYIGLLLSYINMEDINCMKSEKLNKLTDDEFNELLSEEDTLKKALSIKNYLKGTNGFWRFIMVTLLLLQSGTMIVSVYSALVTATQHIWLYWTTIVIGVITSIFMLRDLYYSMPEISIVTKEE